MAMPTCAAAKGQASLTVTDRSIWHLSLQLPHGAATLSSERGQYVVITLYTEYVGGGPVVSVATPVWPSRIWSQRKSPQLRR